MAGEFVLAIDHGTQSVRALLFDLRGNLLAKSRVRLILIFHRDLAWLNRIQKFSGKSYCSLPGALANARR